MKIRTDFVTNSSSSSFSVCVSIYDKSGKEYSIMDEPYDEGGSAEAYFSGNLGDIKNISTIKELCDFLIEAIEDDSWCDSEGFPIEYDEEYGDEYYDEELIEGKRELEESKKNFSESVIRNVKSIDNISKIVVERYYWAMGEYSELVADNDEKLCSLAKKFRNSLGDEKEKAKKELLEYIHNPDPDIGKDFNFGSGYGDFRYRWDGNDEDLENLVERLCSNCGPDSVGGKEHEEINMETGEYIAYAEFYLE